MSYPYNAEKQAELFNAMLNPAAATLHSVEDTEKNDPRLPFQRDRDRIVWSNSFKRLANKTQVFPQVYSDHQRQRMTHTLEVAQLSTSICRTLGLNFILAEAIALAHDLGHTPFGHAGETAIDEALSMIKFVDLGTEARGLSRFTHYEQGLDVVNYMATIDPFKKKKRGKHDPIGLDLSEEIQEGILKHVHNQQGPQTEYKSLSFLLEHTKYGKEVVGKSLTTSKGEFFPGTLESQVVRICDKICYFISDIEDGLIIDAIHIQDLKDRDLFSEILEKAEKTPGNDVVRFGKVRDEILTKLVNSVLKQGQKIEVEEKTGLTIRPDTKMQKCMREFRVFANKNIFDHHILVKRANRRAKHIVGCLFCQYIRHPELISWDFRKKYIVKDEKNNFKKRLEDLYLLESGGKELFREVACNMDAWFHKREEDTGLECFSAVSRDCKPTIAEIICVKDFVAGMTDDFAEMRYKMDVDCCASQRTWKRCRMDKRTFYETSSVR